MKVQSVRPHRVRGAWYVATPKGSSSQLQTIKPRLLIAGYGELGSKVAGLAAQQGMDVTGLCRSNRPSPPTARLIACDVSQQATLAPLSELSPDYLLYCVAADAQTDASYQSQYVDGLTNVLHALKGAPLRHVFFISSTRVYGQATDSLLDEEVQALPADFGGERLLQAEQIALAHGVPATVLRLSGIYGPGRLRMLKLAQQPPESWPANSWTNRIHIEDAAGCIAHLIHKRLDGELLQPRYIVTDNAPVSMHEVLNWLAQQMGMPYPVSSAPVTDGKRLSNHLLLQSGYTLRYPSYQKGYSELLANCAR
jgi:nucleoside-diphosphate-sugar epimerase